MYEATTPAARSGPGLRRGRGIAHTPPGQGWGLRHSGWVHRQRAAGGRRLPRGRCPGRPDAARRHPRRPCLSDRRAGLQDEACRPLQLSGLFDAGPARGYAAGRARAQPAHGTHALSPRPAGHPGRRRRAGGRRRRPAGRVAARDAALSGRGRARSRGRARRPRSRARRPARRGDRGLPRHGRDPPRRGRLRGDARGRPGQRRRPRGSGAALARCRRGRSAERCHPGRAGEVPRSARGAPCRGPGAALPRRPASRQHRAPGRAPGALRLHRVQRGAGHGRRALRPGLPADGSRRARAGVAGPAEPPGLCRPDARGRGPFPNSTFPLRPCRHPGQGLGPRRRGLGRQGRARRRGDRGTVLSGARASRPRAGAAAAGRHRRQVRHRQVHAGPGDGAASSGPCPGRCFCAAT